jgi:hypothetical protein
LRLLLVFPVAGTTGGDEIVSMIIVGLLGGLGNQLFQYAFGRALALKHQVPLALDISSFQGNSRPSTFAEFPRKFRLAAFNISAAVATDEQVAETRDRRRAGVHTRLISAVARRWMPRLCLGYFAEPSLNYDPRWRSLTGHVYVSGYFQSYKYFADIAAVLRSELSFRDSGRALQAACRVESIRQRFGDPIIGVHIRRGDIAHAHEALKQPEAVGLALTPGSYYLDAMKQFEEAGRFLIFCEPMDVEWCTRTLKGPNVELYAGKTDLDDFAAMQQCDHLIISNSTFSWWAAWLNERPNMRVIAPRRWFAGRAAALHDQSDLLLPHWKVV